MDQQIQYTVCLFRDGGTADSGSPVYRTEIPALFEDPSISRAAAISLAERLAAITPKGIETAVFFSGFHEEIKIYSHGAPLLSKSKITYGLKREYEVLTQYYLIRRFKIEAETIQVNAGTQALAVKHLPERAEPLVKLLKELKTARHELGL